MAAPLSNAQIQQLWIANGGDPKVAPLMAAIAMAESGGRTSAHNTTAPDDSVGLWQINYYGGLRAPRTQAFGTPAAMLADPNAQARAAIAIYKSQGLSAWSTYTHKTYQQFLQGAAALPAGGGTTPGAAGTGATPAQAAAAAAALGEAAASLTAQDLAPQQAIYSSACLISTPKVFGIGGSCLLSKAEAKVFLGGLLMVGGGIVTTVGLILLASYGLQASGAGGALAASALKLTPAGRAVGLVGKASPAAKSRTAARGAPSKTPPASSPPTKVET